ncbi:glycosyltransferase family 4 protein [Stappia taiwanensis]|uniref:Glycosyltransferase family 4 protein n=1 Tax=Stappia taiwanensis TaxID=992267 RepID=A0A838XRR5_9HYPH|nr:glycosyltransferase family 4 protein [Stappia taiwanensis]MBA4611751.1 glycosyltransferase family 4 protein [Stappia taiwanensis]GGE97078.1 polysaccharide biosynthesis protein [Stappia taiwanensis]
MTRTPDRIVILNDRSIMTGGASNLACLSAQLLEAAGCAVTFFAGDGEGAFTPARQTIWVGGRPLTEQSRLSALSRGLYNPRAAEKLNRFITQHDTPATIYHVHGWSKILSPSIFRVLARVRERTVLHAHDYFLACPNGGFVNFRSQTVCGLAPLSVRCLASRCDKRGQHEKAWRLARHELRERFFPVRRQAANIVLIHEGMSDYFLRAGVRGGLMRAIRNPVEPFLWPTARPWAGDAVYFIGRLEPEKGFEDAAIAARLAGARLHVIGDGAGRSLLQRKYPEVVIHGWKARSEIGPLLNKARAVVVASRVPEPFGLVAVEAVGSGIPVILPDAALLAPEIVDHGCGLTFKSGNPASLAAAIGEILRDDGKVRHMSASALLAAPGMALTSRSWGEALTSLYAEVLERTRPVAAQSAPRAVPIPPFETAGLPGGR